MESVREKLNERANSTDNEGFHEISDEVSSNWGLYTRELEEPTLKHGTDTTNFEDIVEEGLVPGKENDAETGELSNHEDVCFSTSYSIALRYAEVTEANNYLRNPELENVNVGTLESPMVVEIPLRSFDSIKIDSKNVNAIRETLGADLNRYHASVVSEACEQGPNDEYPLSEFFDYDEDGIIADVEDGDESAQEAGYSLLNDEKINPEILMKYGFFEHLDHNELDASFLNEVCTSYVPEEEMSIYIPKSELKEYRQRAKEDNLDIKIGSLEGRALVHEARMEEKYEESGCISYTRPEDGKYGINVIKSDEEHVSHNSSPDVIHMSRLDGEPIYPTA